MLYIGVHLFTFCFFDTLEYSTHDHSCLPSHSNLHVVICSWTSFYGWHAKSCCKQSYVVTWNWWICHAVCLINGVLGILDLDSQKTISRPVQSAEILFCFGMSSSLSCSCSIVEANHSLWQKKAIKAIKLRWILACGYMEKRPTVWMPLETNCPKWRFHETSWLRAPKLQQKRKGFSFKCHFRLPGSYVWL